MALVAGLLIAGAATVGATHFLVHRFIIEPDSRLLATRLNRHQNERRVGVVRDAQISASKPFKN